MNSHKTSGATMAEVASNNSKNIRTKSSDNNATRGDAKSAATVDENNKTVPNHEVRCKVRVDDNTNIKESDPKSDVIQSNDGEERSRELLSADNGGSKILNVMGKRMASGVAITENNGSANASGSIGEGTTVDSQTGLPQTIKIDSNQERSNRTQGSRSLSSNAGIASQDSTKSQETVRSYNKTLGQLHHSNLNQNQHHYQHNYSSVSTNNIHQNNKLHSHGNQHHIGHQSQHHDHQHNHDQLSKTNLYIRGLDPETGDGDLFTLCSRFGSIVSKKAIMDKNTNKCKGYGFVDFASPAAAEAAVAELQKQGFNVHMAKQQDADPTNLYIANLPQTMTETELEALLQPYGQVVSTRILVNQNRQPRGVGFARMETKEQCDSIIASLNGQVFKDSREPLLIKFADGANKKRTYHFQHKPLSGNHSFMGNNPRRNNSNDTNHYHSINTSNGNRSFHGGPSSEHSMQNHAIPHHDSGLIKQSHQQQQQQQQPQQHQQQQQQPQPPHQTHQQQQQQQPLLSSVPSYHPHHQGTSHHSFMMQQPHAQMMVPTYAIDPSLHYVNLASQMQGLQIGNHPVGGYMSPQPWPQVWPGGSSTFTNTTTSSNRDAVLR